jgi:hypothetical protein
MVLVAFCPTTLCHSQFILIFSYEIYNQWLLCRLPAARTAFSVTLSRTQAQKPRWLLEKRNCILNVLFIAVLKRRRYWKLSPLLARKVLYIYAIIILHFKPKTGMGNLAHMSYCFVNFQKVVKILTTGAILSGFCLINSTYIGSTVQNRKH